MATGRRAALLSTALVLTVSAGGVDARTTHVRAVDLRAGVHPTFVRVVVDLAGGSIIAGQVEATDPNPIDGSARLLVRSAGATASAAPLTAFGVHASAASAGGGFTVSLSAAIRRFKYLEYFVLNAPERLVIDLWTAPPPPPGEGVFRGRRGCLTLASFSTGGGVARASGRERFLFEHSFVLIVRNHRGVIVGERPQTATGPWSGTVRYRPTGRPGTLEAFAASAKDGSLDCLVQARVRLR